jgi:hypothetical protein
MINTESRSTRRNVNIKNKRYRYLATQKDMRQNIGHTFIKILRADHPSTLQITVRPHYIKLKKNY